MVFVEEFVDGFVEWFVFNVLLLPTLCSVRPTVSPTQFQVASRVCGTADFPFFVEGKVVLGHFVVVNVLLFNECPYSTQFSQRLATTL